MSSGEPEKPSRALATVIMFGFLAVMALGVGAVVLVVMPGALFVLAFVVGVAAFHYLVWGKWLGPLLRSQAAADNNQDEPPPSPRG